MTRPTVDLTGARILAVDDIPENLDVLLHTLEESGYEVFVATDGEQALKIAAEERPDAILLDVMMPGIDGYETCRRLKAQPAFAEVPILFLTARDDIEGVMEGFTAGGVDYIVKPFRKEEVLIRLRTHLERDRYARDLADLNAHLEEKVLERTAQLRLSLRELHGRDRIARHMLTLHPLDETLQLVLEIITDLIQDTKATVHLVRGEELAAVATSGGPVRASSRGPLLNEARVSGKSHKDVAAGKAFVVVPILRDAQVQGVIELERSGEIAIPDAEIRILESFALEAGLAIGDAQIRRDPSTWENHLDEILEIETELSSEEYFDRLEGDGDTR
ncbi:MAG: response regulator [Gemmatimonadetes bacterium]|jgi:DNA-binding response OmpR family regulator|nr:response regulator [Gemmatimonadota bacterium]MBT7858957.1 response regulator [Gemmatimonadota bacterium]